MQSIPDPLFIFDRISDGFIALDSNYCYTYANKKIGQLTGLDPEWLVGKCVWDVFPDAVGTETYKSFEKAMKEQCYVVSTDHYPPLNLWQENHIYPSPQGLFVFIRDISETMRSKIELQEKNEELRNFSTHLQKVREEEQTRIAREIHDELGQQITGLKMDVGWLRRRLSHHIDILAAQDKLNSMNNLMDQTIQSIRKIASQLRPSILDDLGLVAALEWQSQEFIKRFKIPVEFQSESKELNVDPAIATGLFRIFQESLTNIARHADTDKVYAKLEIPDGKLRLIIKDDGKGFDLAHADFKKSLGLVGMKERAKMIGGELELKSEPGKGTVVEVTVPAR